MNDSPEVDRLNIGNSEEQSRNLSSSVAGNSGLFNKPTKLSNPKFDSSPIAEAPITEDDQEYEPIRFMPTP